EIVARVDDERRSDARGADLEIERDDLVGTRVRLERVVLLELVAVRELRFCQRSNALLERERRLVDRDAGAGHGIRRERFVRALQEYVRHERQAEEGGTGAVHACGTKVRR